MLAWPSPRRRQRTVSGCVGILPYFLSMSTRRACIPHTDGSLLSRRGSVSPVRCYDLVTDEEIRVHHVQRSAILWPFAWRGHEDLCQRYGCGIVRSALASVSVEPRGSTPTFSMRSVQEAAGAGHQPRMHAGGGTYGIA